MLIHIRPSCFSEYRQVDLIDVEIPEFALCLRQGRELNARRPYPSEQWVVASAAAERRAKSGFFIQMPGQYDTFTTIARWSVDAEEIVKHVVEYQVLDNEFDAVSDDPILWYGIRDEYGRWEKRWPDCIPPDPPEELQPRLQLRSDGGAERTSEVFRMPTLERGRILTCSGTFYPGNPAPNETHAFVGKTIISV